MPKKSGQSSPSSSPALSKKASSPSPKVERGGSTLPISPFAVSGGGASTRSDAKSPSPVDSDGSSDSNASDNGLETQGSSKGNGWGHKGQFDAQSSAASDGKSSINSPQAGSAKGDQLSSPPSVSSLSSGGAEETISEDGTGHQVNPVNPGDNGLETQGSSKGNGGDHESHFDAQSSGYPSDDQPFLNSAQAGSAKGDQLSSPSVSSPSSGGAEETISDGDAGRQVNPVAPGAQSSDASDDKSPINSPQAGSASGSKDFKEEPAKPMLFSALEYLARPFLGALNILWEITGFLIKLFSLGTVDLSAQKNRPVGSRNFEKSDDSRGSGNTVSSNNTPSHTLSP